MVKSLPCSARDVGSIPGWNYMLNGTTKNKQKKPQKTKKPEFLVKKKRSLVFFRATFMLSWRECSKQICAPGIKYSNHSRDLNWGRGGRNSLTKVPLTDTQLGWEFTVFIPSLLTSRFLWFLRFSFAICFKVLCFLVKLLCYFMVILKVLVL